MTGAPTFIAMSMIFTILFANISPRLPPNTVKSWENTNTRRLSIVPYPVTTPSPGIFFFSMSKSVVRWTTNRSVSTNDPGSRRWSSRSRAVSFPRFRCASIRSGPPPIRASAFRRRSSWTLGSSATGDARRQIPLTLSCRRVGRRDGFCRRLLLRKKLREEPTRQTAEEPEKNWYERDEEDDEPPARAEDRTQNDHHVVHRRDSREDEEPEEPRGRRCLDPADGAHASPPGQVADDAPGDHRELPDARGEEDEGQDNPKKDGFPPGVP